jgi:hypothetical protein
MTHKSKREIERAIEDLTAADERDTTIIFRQTVHGTEWSGGGLDPGETETTVREIHVP